MRVGTAPPSVHRGRARSAVSAAVMHAASITARRPLPSERPGGYEGKMLMVGHVTTDTACVSFRLSPVSG